MFDVCVMHRVELSDGVFDAILQLKACGITVVADFDDCLFTEAYAAKLVEEGRAASSTVMFEAARHEGLLRAADHCTASTASLTEMIATAREGVGGFASTLSNCFSQALYMGSIAGRRSQEGYSTGGQVTVGYASGSASHNNDFAIVRPVLERLLERHTSLRLVLLGALDFDPFPAKFASRVQRIGLIPHAELPIVLGRFDINLAPLKQDQFNSYKSAIKVIEAALVGVPTVASATAPYREAIEHGVTGLIAQSEAEWEQHLESLISNIDLRRSIGHSAAKYCSSAYSPEAWLQNFRDLKHKWRRKNRFPAKPSNSKELSTFETGECTE
jgi:hypothetical protein